MGRTTTLWVDGVTGATGVALHDCTGSEWVADEADRPGRCVECGDVIGRGDVAYTGPGGWVLCGECVVVH